ncbi:MAG: hypothetical protein AAF290_17385 [Pseudomonadota bacterium]
MTRLSDTVFPEFLTEVRDAYLLSVRYDNDPQCFVAVCIVTAEWANEDAIRRTVQNEFAKMFSSKMSLDIVFPNVKQQQAIKKFLPFYSSDNQLRRQPDFYLASTEGYGLNEPHACWLQDRGSYGDRDDIALVAVRPPVDIVVSDGSTVSLTSLALAGRHVGESIFDDHEWPLYVHIAKPAQDIAAGTTSLPNTALETVAWGEIYQTTDEARKATGRE